LAIDVPGPAAAKDVIMDNLQSLGVPFSDPILLPFARFVPARRP
jgi:hypothetical protein